MLYFEKWTAKSHFSLKKSNQKGPYDTDTGPHRPILFPKLARERKRVAHPDLHDGTLRYV